MPVSYSPMIVFAPMVLIVVSAAGLAFHFINKSINGLMAVVGALIVAVAVLYLSLLLTVNVMGS